MRVGSGSRRVARQESLSWNVRITFEGNVSRLRQQSALTDLEFTFLEVAFVKTPQRMGFRQNSEARRQ